jgi:hypothetical protein
MLLPQQVLLLLGFLPLLYEDHFFSLEFKFRPLKSVMLCLVFQMLRIFHEHLGLNHLLLQRLLGLKLLVLRQDFLQGKVLIE